MPVDKEDMLKAIKEFPKQCREALALPKGIAIQGPISHIVVAGMGGSAIGGDILKTFMRNSKIPVTVSRDYRVPSFVNQDTLVFVVSYSGNTEETLRAFYDAYEKKAKIVTITSGGKLADDAQTLIKVPSGMQPRAALGYLFFPMLGVLHNSEIIRIKNEELNEMIDLLKRVDEFDEEGEALAKKLRDKIPIVYASDKNLGIAMRWKTQMNENAKIPAFYNVFSEMNHNEIAAYIGMDRKFVAIIIKDKTDHDQIKKRMDLCKELMEDTVDVENVVMQGSGLLARIFSTIFLGDFVSYYLAIWRRVDPSPVTVIEALKKKLG